MGSGEERRGNPGCSGEGMRAVQCYGCTPANAQPSQRHPHTRRNLLGVGVPPFSVLRGSLCRVTSAVSQQSPAAHPQRSRPGGRGTREDGCPRHSAGTAPQCATRSAALVLPPRMGEHTEKPVCNKTESSYFVCFSGEWEGLTPA